MWISLQFGGEVHGHAGDLPPLPGQVFCNAQDFVREKSGLANIGTATFSNKFNMAFDLKQRICQINTTIQILRPGKNKPSDKGISVSMKYLGDNKFEYVRADRGQFYYLIITKRKVNEILRGNN